MPTEGPLPVRRSARLIILSPENRVLLFRYHDEHRAPFWSSVGGELVGNETYREAARRELHEETGMRLEIGSFLKQNEAEYAVARSTLARWIEHYFLVESASEFIPNRRGWTDEEKETIRDCAWWSAREIQQTTDSFLPEWLPSSLCELMASRESSGP